MNPANLITSLRLLLVIPVAIALFRYSAQYPGGDIWRYTAFALFLAAALMDLADGYVARRFKCISKLGSILDPVSDKVQCITIIIVITVANHLGHVPIWYPSVMIAKDIAIGVSAFVIWKRNAMGDIRPLALGKLATFVQNFTICWLILLWPIALAIMVISGVVNILAGLAYLYVWLRPYFGKREPLGVAG